MTIHFYLFLLISWLARLFSGSLFSGFSQTHKIVFFLHIICILKSISSRGWSSMQMFNSFLILWFSFCSHFLGPTVFLLCSHRPCYTFDFFFSPFERHTYPKAGCKITLYSAMDFTSSQAYSFLNCTLS